MATKGSTEYKRAFSEKAYDRLAITVPKGRKTDIEAHAKAEGVGSINGLVNTLLRVDMGLSEADWKEKPEE